MNNKNTKKSHTSIENKLKAYSALAVSLIAFANNSKAQIVYHNITPDTTISDGGLYLLDLNGDGTPDFKFLQSGHNNTNSGSFSNSVMVYPLAKGNKILDTINNVNHYPPALNLNYSVGPNPKKLVWTSSNNQSLILNHNVIISAIPFSQNKGYWVGITDKYLGLSIEVNDKTYYGWVRLDVPQDARKFTIKSYAYDSNPNQTVFAGDTIKTNINKNNPDILGLETIIYTHYKDLYVNFVNSDPIKVTINLFNLTGQLLKSIEVVTNENHVRIEDIASGIYLLNIQTSKGNLYKKIHIE